MSSPGQETKREFVVTQKGIGRPDFSEEVFRSNVRAGYPIQEGEQFKAFTLMFSNLPSLAPYIRGPLLPGETAILMDPSTGITMPYTIEKGYIFESIQDTHNFTQLIRADAYFDGILATSAFADTLGLKYYQILKSWTSKAYDPTGLSSHTFRLAITNLSATVNVLGFLEMQTIIKALGTPPFPNKKTVKCKWCGFEKVVDWNTSLWTCPKCNKKTLFTVEEQGYPRETN